VDLDQPVLSAFRRFRKIAINDYYRHNYEYKQRDATI